MFLPPIWYDGVLHDGQEDRLGPKTMSGRSCSWCPQPSARQRGDGSRCIAPHWRQNHALGQREDRAVGPPSASSSRRLVKTSRVPVPCGEGDQKAFSWPSSSWVALPFSNPRSRFPAPRANSRSRTCFSKKCWPQLRQVRIGKKASSWRPAYRSLASLNERNRCSLGSASVPSRATTISSRPRRKKWTLGRRSDSPPF